jgi:hypothetical protein
MIRPSSRGRCAASVVVVQRESVVRHDVGDENPRSDFVIAPGTRLADAIERALDGGPRPKRVLVITDHVHTQTLDLAHKAVDGLADAALTHALAYEIEPLCAVRARSATLGVTRLHVRDDRRTMWVVVCDGAERDEVDAVVLRRGATLIGIAPPLGWLPTAAGAWIDVGTSATACGVGDAVQRVVASRPDQRSWATAIAEWRASAPADVRWFGIAAAPATDTERADASRAQATDQELAVAIAANAAHRLAEGAALPAPRIPAGVRPRRTLGPVAAGALAALCACALVGFDAWTLVHDVGRLERSAAEATQRVAAASRQNLEVTKERQALEQRRGEVATMRACVLRLERGLERQRGRLAALLDATRTLVPDSMMLRSIAPDVAGVPTLAGVALDPAAVGGFADALDRELSGAGWRVRPAITERGQDRDAGLTVFRIAVTPIDAPETGDSP